MDLAQFIVDLQDTEYQPVTIEQWKDREGKPITLWTRSLTNDERDAIEEACNKEVRKGKRVTIVKDNKRLRLMLLQFATCKGNGNPEPLFTMEQAEKLRTKNTHATELLVNSIVKLSFPKEDADELLGN